MGTDKGGIGIDHYDNSIVGAGIAGISDGLTNIGITQGLFCALLKKRAQTAYIRFEGCVDRDPAHWCDPADKITNYDQWELCGIGRCPNEWMEYFDLKDRWTQSCYNDPI